MIIGKDMMNDSGQIGIDYLIGISTFIFTFFFLYSTLTSLFLPFEYNSDEVQPMTERASAIMVESADWLAIDSSSPNIIDKTKVRQLNSDLNDQLKYDDDRSRLGLMTTNLDYNLNISLRYFNNTPYPNASSPLLMGGSVPDDTTKVGQIIRYVYLSQDSRRLMLSVKVWL